MSTILVTGAAGFVGSHVIPALVEAGHRIVGLCRSDAAANLVQRRLPEPHRAAVETRIGDVVAPATLAPALEGVDAVYHLAAIPRDYSRGADLRLVNTEGTRFMVEAAKRAGVRRFVHQGALGVEDEPDLHYASSKAKADRIVADSGLDWTILQPSLLWGERDGFFNIMADLVRISPGIVPVPAGAKSQYQPISIADLARCVVACFADDSRIGRSFELGGPTYWSYGGMLAEVLRGMDARRATLPMPVPLIRLVAGTSELLRIPFPVATDQLRQLGLHNATSLLAVQDGFGFEPVDMAGNLGYLRRPKREQEPWSDG